jgi:N-methylhydantoinase A
VSEAIDLAKVRAIFQKKLGDPLNTDAENAAAAVLQIATTRMAGATRMVSVSLGEDPRDFSLFAFGGAGPMHASALARELGIPEVLVPARPGITNALGCIVADLKHDFVRTVNRPLNLIDIDDVMAITKAQRDEGIGLIRQEPVSIEEIRVTHWLDMQFVGQTHILQVPLPPDQINREAIQLAFDEAYFARFRVSLSEIRAQVVNVKTTVNGRRPDISLTELIDASGRSENLVGAQTGTRLVWFNGGWLETRIFDREALPLNAKITGPAVLEQMDTMVLIEPGDQASSDKDGNILITLGDAL